MVSRRSTGPLRKILPAVAVGLAAIGLVGCSAGQVTQTDRVLPAVDGNAGDAGDNALRDVLIAAPESGGDYSAGDDAPLTLTIVNRGTADDELTSVSSPAAGKVELIGDTTLPSRAALRVLVPEESSSASATSTETSETSETSATSESSPGSTETSQPAGSSSAAGTAASEPAVTGTELAPEVVGSLSIVLTDLTADLLPGRNVPITFVFAEGGSVTINVPIDNAGDARTASADSESE
jgi:copper(I)-binding protein